ncbi:CEP41 isoform 17 [Pan troglodytes]|uniref:CEP41 isoform 16 n=5 Tax=Homininae TaxID=207598 RepID=A0A6D2W5G9_PANTR|nr:centrosomal protein of 41 kDa isoform 4 [Homo sapiens]PNI99523.1 CEP41 isoform 16 [Pan troglodytes]AAM43960.1 testis specific protein A14 s-type [Homo sapiens]KAI2547919.1 centrosomal protein 41 [Homo sapiens]KAI4015845.1 centrosomal protein 41 [Homo sapiens]PNI99524.1 CEP41 isoform 17 [Pan troglodytes]|eukprot:NP_001244089.1 centrosomal protein of 41 kDa isoform 4 [Homo sapiens]
MSLRRHIGNPEYLMKRIPQNPRYQHIKSRLDTGACVYLTSSPALPDCAMNGLCF